MRAAVDEAMTLGCADAAAVRHLVEVADLTHALTRYTSWSPGHASNARAGDDGLRWAARPGADA